MSTHTPGPWIIRTIPQGMAADIYKEGKPEPIATTAFLGWSKDQMEANARLIAEAGTVATETGLTPRQLAEVNRELVAALEYSLKCLQQSTIGTAHHQPAIAALAKAKGENQ